MTTVPAAGDAELIKAARSLAEREHDNHVHGGGTDRFYPLLRALADRLVAANERTDQLTADFNDCNSERARWKAKAAAAEARIASLTEERDAAIERVHYAEGTAQANIDRANDAEARLAELERERDGWKLVRQEDWDTTFSCFVGHVGGQMLHRREMPEVWASVFRNNCDAETLTRLGVPPLNPGNQTNASAITDQEAR